MASVRTMCLSVVVIITMSLTGLPVFVNCGNITDAENLHTALLTNYNKDVRPILNQSETLNVTIYTVLRSVQDLNELTGELSFTGALLLNWNDVKLQWDPANYGGMDKTYISYQSVWVPEIIITTTTDLSDTMAKKWQKVTYEANGFATFAVGDRISASCNLNVEKYPFDKQTCRVRFAAWGYESTDVGIIVGRSTVDIVQYEGHSIWNLAKTETLSTIIDTWSYYEVFFYFERKASFTIVNLVMPLLLMSLLNALVFVLVPESGERVSYSVTVLLAIAVFLTIVSDTLPASSEPVPMITYKLMVDMMLSGLITLTTILNLRLYHKEDDKPVPRRLQSIYRFLHFDHCCRTKSVFRNTKVGTADEEEHNKEKREDIVGDELMSVDDAGNQIVTWKDISYMVDYIALAVFSFASVLSFVVYIIKVVS